VIVLLAVAAVSVARMIRSKRAARKFLGNKVARRYR
jgi:hypothetical protein